MSNMNESEAIIGCCGTILFFGGGSTLAIWGLYFLLGPPGLWLGGCLAAIVIGASMLWEANRC